MGKYDDIINLPHYVSAERPHMSRSARAAQFAPFAALTGYDDEIKETARYTDSKADIDEYVKEEINTVLLLLKEKISELPEAKITYFIPDERKSGGKYVTIKEKIKKIDEFTMSIFLVSGKEISINDIYEIEA